MIRALYSSASGMNAQELAIDTIANNLANVNTNGFKRTRIDHLETPRRRTVRPPPNGAEWAVVTSADP